eukprot:11740657-Heterocapsa_arctica.AAC.1
MHGPPCRRWGSMGPEQPAGSRRARLTRERWPSRSGHSFVTWLMKLSALLANRRPSSAAWRQISGSSYTTYFTESMIKTTGASPPCRCRSSTHWPARPA